MRTFDIILFENAELVNKERLVNMYNEAVQEIWYLSGKLDQMREENNALWRNNGELIDKLYG